MRRLLLAVMLATALTAAAVADDVVLQASLDRTTVSVGEQAVLTIQAQGGRNLPTPQLPSMPDFDTYSASQSQNFSVINGHVSASVTFTYMLTPHRAGKFTIPPVRLLVEGRSYQTRPLDLEVVRSVVKPPSPNLVPPSFPPPVGLHPKPRTNVPQAQGYEPAPPDLHEQAPLFVTGNVDKPTVYVGQATTYIFRLYRRLGLQSNPRYTPPDTTGFLAEDLPPQRSYNTVVDGKSYVVSELRTALFATAPGDYTLSAARLVCQIQDLLPGFLNDEDMRRFFMTGEQRELQTDTVNVRVKPLPLEGRPASWSGAVGMYRIEARLDQKSAQVGQPLNLEVTVSGQGNVNLITPPHLPPLKDFKVYDTVTGGNLSKANHRVSGTRKFTTPLLPLQAGTLQIPPIEFSYFDTDGKRYRTISSRPLTLKVKPGQNQAAVTPTAAASEPAQASPVQPLRPLHGSFQLRERRTPLLENPWFRAMQAVPALWLLGSICSGWAQKRRQGSLAARTRSSALRRAQSSLRRLPREAAGLAQLPSVLHTYMRDRTGTTTSGLSMRDLEERLSQWGVAAEHRERLRQLLEGADTVRFSPAAAASDQVDASMRNASELLVSLERTLR